MNFLRTTICLALVTAAPSAFSQGPGGIPGVGSDFVAAASQDGMTEVEMSKLALARSSNPAIKQFASRMVQDHTQANNQLLGIAKKEGIAVSPKLDPAHSAAVKALGDKKGADFDAAYSSTMISNHQKAVATFQNESSDTSHSDLQSFAQSTLPTLREHLDMAQKLPNGGSAGM